METVGNEPVLRFEVRPAGEMPSYPINEAPTPVKSWTFIEARITDAGSYDQYNKPFLDFEKNVIQANAGSSNFVWNGHTASTSFEGKGIPTPPDINLGHLLENNARLSNRRRAAHYRHGGRYGSGTERKVAWPDISCPGMIEE